MKGSYFDHELNQVNTELSDSLVESSGNPAKVRREATLTKNRRSCRAESDLAGVGVGRQRGGGWPAPPAACPLGPGARSARAREAPSQKLLGSRGGGCGDGGEALDPPPRQARHPKDAGDETLASAVCPLLRVLCSSGRDDEPEPGRNR